MYLAIFCAGQYTKYGTYTAKWGRYVSDQTPARTQWVGLYGLCEGFRRDGEAGGVLVADTPHGTQLAVRRFNVLLSPTEQSSAAATVAATGRRTAESSDFRCPRI